MGITTVDQGQHIHLTQVFILDVLANATLDSVGVQYLDHDNRVDGNHST